MWRSIKLEAITVGAVLIIQVWLSAVVPPLLLEVCPGHWARGVATRIHLPGYRLERMPLDGCAPLPPSEPLHDKARWVPRAHPATRLP